MDHRDSVADPNSDRRLHRRRVARAGGDRAARSSANESAAEPQPELYRIREAAAMLAVSPRMVYALIESRELPTVRLPGTGRKRRPVRISRLDLKQFLDRLRENSA